MPHEEILKIIETVDPKDTAKLDEIDARVWCWLGGEHWGRLKPVEFVEYGRKPYRLLDDDEAMDYADNPKNAPLGFTFTEYYREFWWKDEPEKGRLLSKESFFTIGANMRYTRSRDALKAIRPDKKRWNLKIEVWGEDHATCNIWLKPYCDTGITFHSLPKRSEELAELHAIIQAIAYERGLL